MCITLCRRIPSFLYAMPFSKTKIFLEETSLVARPAVPYQELKQRLEVGARHGTPSGLSRRSFISRSYCSTVLQCKQASVYALEGLLACVPCFAACSGPLKLHRDAFVAVPAACSGQPRHSAAPATAPADQRAWWQVRLQHLGVKVTRTEDEEYCLIPMGGVLPRLPQRVLGIGGTGGMVHPSTGELLGPAGEEYMRPDAAPQRGGRTRPGPRRDKGARGLVTTSRKLRLASAESRRSLRDLCLHVCPSNSRSRLSPDGGNA